MRKYANYLILCLFAFCLTGDSILSPYYETGIHSITFITGTVAISLSFLINRRDYSSLFIDRILVLFVLLVFVMSLNYPDLSEYGEYKITLMLWYVIPLIGSRIVIRNNSDYITLLIAMLLLLIIGTTLGGLHARQIQPTTAFNYRYQFGEPITVARLFGMLILLAYSLRNRVGVVATISIILYGLYGIAMTGTRGAFISLILSFLLYYICFYPRKSPLRMRDIIYLCTFTLILILTPVIFDLYSILGEGFGRIIGGFDVSEDMGRVDYWRAAIDQWFSAPILGAGTGTFGSLFGEYLIRSYPHNIVLEVLAENGIVGIIPFSLIMYVSLNNVRTIRNSISFFQEYMFIPLCVVYGFLTALVSMDICNQTVLWIGVALSRVNINNERA